jgi:hypothetical protein
MKAKYFKKLRPKVKYYNVWETYNLFGNFDLNKGYYETILARNEREAINRLRKKQHKKLKYWERTEQDWAKYSVIPVSKPFERFRTFWT